MATLTEELRRGRKNNQYSDVTVSVEGKDYPCHKVVLASRSQVFDTILKNGKKETEERRIEVEGVTTETFEALLAFMYEDKNILTRKNFFDVLIAANQLQVESLMIKGKKYLKDNLYLGNCGRVHVISQARLWKDLEESAWTLLEKNFEKVDLKELCVLSYENMKRLIGSDHLKARSEDLVMEKALQWVDCVTCADPGLNDPNDEDPPEVLLELLKSCRYLLISYNFLWETLNKNRYVQTDPTCEQLVMEIAQYKTQLDTHQYGCHRAELHRATDLLQDVRIDIFPTNLNVFQANFKGNSQRLNLPFPQKPVKSTGGAYYNGTTYFEVSDKSAKTVTIYEYDPLQEKVTCCNESANPHGNVTYAFLPVGNSLVALRTLSVYNNNYLIEQIELPCKPSYRWVSLGSPTTRDMEVECVTNIGSNLLIFWVNSDHDSLTIECYDLDRQKSHILEHNLGPSTSLKTFKKRDRVFALQGDGMLWSLHALEYPPYVQLVQEKQLWTGQERLQAAMLMSDRLLVYRKDPTPHKTMKWYPNISVDGVFTQKYSIAVTGKLLNTLHAVLDRNILPKLE